MSNKTSPPEWPPYLSKADYARACAQVTGHSVSRHTLEERIRRGTVRLEKVKFGTGIKEMINTTTYPPGPVKDRWANKNKPTPIPNDPC